VRVDILERLADLIRPALAWREGSSQTKPDGAVDGRGFTVTGAMTSLTGASGEDFASILRALGYRMDRRPSLPAEPAPAEAPPVAEPTPADAPAPETSSTVKTAETSPPEAAPAEPVAETPPAENAAAEPAMVEVWRPGRPPGEHRSRKTQPRPRRRPQQVSLPKTEDASAQAAPQNADAKPQRSHRNRKHDGARKHDLAIELGDRPRRERRNRPIDPNSPFAALLELKARLESGNDSGKKNEEKSEG